MRAEARSRDAPLDHGTRSHGSARRPDRRSSNRPVGQAQPTASITRPRSARPPSAVPMPQLFLGVDDQLGASELAAQAGVVALQLLDLSRRRVRLRPPLFRRERRLIGRTELLAPARDHRGVDALATQERTERTGRLATFGLGQQPALLAPGELAPSGDRHDLRVATRSVPSATASQEEPNNPFAEDFSNEVTCMSYLYSKLSETGVPHHIGTGGHRPGAGGACSP